MGSSWIVQPGCTARSLPKDQLKQEVEKVTGAGLGTVGNCLLQAVQDPDSGLRAGDETAALMLGTSKSRGYCLEMICADFLAGAHMEGGNSESLLFALGRLYSLLPDQQKMEFVQQMGKVQCAISNHDDREF